MRQHKLSRKFRGERLLERLIASEVADVWSGAMIGLYSTGNGRVVAHPADFDWFEDHPVQVPYKPEF
jgi:hypothetical protein